MIQLHFVKVPSVRALDGDEPVAGVIAWPSGKGFDWVVPNEAGESATTAFSWEQWNLLKQMVDVLEDRQT